MQFKQDPKVGNSNGESGGVFLKLGDRESVTGVFRGDPREFYFNWETKTEAENWSEGFSFRFRINFLVKENGAWTPKVWEQGTMVYQDLKALNEDYHLENTTVKITRNGTGTNTTYTILPVPKGEVTDEMERIFSDIKLHSLEKKEKSNGRGRTTDEGDVRSTEFEEAPF